MTFYRLNEHVLDPGFFYYQLRSPVWQDQLTAIMEQTTRNQVSIQKQAFFRVVVAPIAEQRRIVAKVDELMAICDELERSLKAVEIGRARALEAVLAEVLEEPGAQATVHRTAA